MNLLPFVIMILIVLGLFSLSQFQGVAAQKKENQIYLAYFKGLREARNEKEEYAYKSTLMKKKQSQQSDPTKDNTTLVKYFRRKRVGWDRGKLNLCTLIKEPHKYSALEDVAIGYVKQLYGHAKFYPKDKDVSQEIVKALIKAYKKEEPSMQFHQLTFEDPMLQDTFYKMVRGTHTYDLEKKIGYPPFSEMFTFETSERPPMNYHYANQTFLEFYFGKDFTKKFIKEEKKELETAKKKCLSPIKKSQLNQMIGDQFMGNQILELLDFKYEPSEKKPAKHMDEKTQITVKVQ